jgi:hypothetical protein
MKAVMAGRRTSSNFLLSALPFCPQKKEIAPEQIADPIMVLSVND